MSDAKPRFFYPASCHPAFMSRRQLLAGGGTLVAACALGARHARAEGDGTALIRQWATLPEDPWAVCHGVRAMGREFTIKSGQRAVDWLLETQLASVSVNGKSFLAYPESVEVHPNMFLKTLLEAGVPLDHPFTHQGQRRTLHEVVDGARLLFRPREVMASANMLPWSTIALARTTSPVRGRWTNAWGEPVDLDAVVEGALRLMEEASRPLLQAMQENRPEAAKAPVHGFTCGGTHMLYALLTAVQTGHAGRDHAERVQALVDLMAWRLHADVVLIESFYKLRAAAPEAYWYEVDAKLKILGHGAECLAFAVQRGLVELQSAQQTRHRAALATLRRMLGELERRHLGEAEQVNPELFRQLVGDTCHARHGLRFA